MHLYRKVHKSKWTIGKKVYPDQEFLAIKASCEEAVRLIEKKRPIVLNLKELKELDDLYKPLCKKMKGYEWTHSEYGNFGLFFYYYQEFGSLVEFVEELNQLCEEALANWCDFEMLVEENLQHWIISNYDKFERVNIAYLYVLYSEHSSLKICCMSHMEIHIPSEDMQPIIKFVRLYAEQYAYLLQDVPNYDLQTYINQIHPF